MQTRKKSALKGGIRSEQIGKASVKQNSSKTDKVWGRNPVTDKKSKSGRTRGEKKDSRRAGTGDCVTMFCKKAKQNKGDGTKIGEQKKAGHGGKRSKAEIGLL